MKVGDTLYHESRYWVQYPAFDEVSGWNARYLPYVVTRVTDKTIFATRCGPDGQTSRVQFPRRKRPKRVGHAPHQTLEADGKQYHSRFCEYFYTEVPSKKPREAPRPMSKCAHALLLLGITPPYSADDVTRAYKRLAKVKHPDGGGSHDDFIRLKDARDVALRGY